jgi:hypothetical protein
LRQARDGETCQSPATKTRIRASCSETYSRLQPRSSEWGTIRDWVTLIQKVHTEWSFNISLSHLSFLSP